MKKSIYFCLMLSIILVSVLNADTTFVHVIDFKNGRFSPDVELAIEYKDGKLNLFTRSKTVGEIFKEIEKKAKIEITVDEGTAQKKASIFILDKTLKEGIEAVLNSIGQRDLAISYKEVAKSPGHQVTSQYGINKVEIRKRSKAEMEKIEETEQKEADEWARQRDKEYRELFERMAKEKNKVAKALSDFANPKATQKQKTQVMTYLRQATIESKDKPLLKMALADSKYAKLQEAIEMGYIHAVGDKPEESDKEFLLGLFKARKNLFLMYALKFTWDERFIAVLTDVVRDKNVAPIGRSLAAEILGFRNVKEAVPVLEEALAQMWGKENITYVHHALTEITGMTYDVINGKAIAHPYEPPKTDPDAGNYLSGK